MNRRLLSLRPSNAVARFGAASPLAVLGPRELLRALEGQAGALLCVPAPAPFVLPGLLRAARDLDAPIGLAQPYLPGAPDGTSSFSSGVEAAARETGFRLPIFLQAGPLRATPGDAERPDRLLGHVAGSLEAGFTLVSLDLSRLAHDAAVRLAAEVARPLIERELALEVEPPRAPGASLWAEEANAFLDDLRRVGVGVDLLRFKDIDLAAGEGGVAVPDWDEVGQLQVVASGFGAALTVEARHLTATAAYAWVEAGVRKVDAVEHFGRVCVRALGGAGSELEERAAQVRLPLGDALAMQAEALESLSPAARSRIEAIGWAEAGALLDVVVGGHLASVAVARLSGKEG